MIPCQARAQLPTWTEMESVILRTMKTNAKAVKAAVERAKQLKNIETAVGKRDLFRLQNVAEKYGVTAPVPAGGMMKQLRQGLSMLPPDVDIVANADKLADFTAASQHPLTGSRAAPAQVGGGETSALDQSADPQVANERILQAEPLHRAAPSAGGAVPGLRMKELFDLVQKGGFETLGKFVAVSVPGGAGAVHKQMVGALVTQMQESFPQVPQHRAREAADCFLHNSHFMLAATKVATEDGAPTLLDSSPSIPEPGQRDGPKLAKKTKVAVAEEKGELTRIARPTRGWVRTSELEALDKARDGNMEAVSLAMRSLKNYDLKRLAEMSDELCWGLDFSSMSRERIVQAVLKRSNSYQATAVKKAARVLNEEALRGILKALDRKDLPFVIEALALPAASASSSASRAARAAAGTLVREVRVAVVHFVDELTTEFGADAVESALCRLEAAAHVAMGGLDSPMEVASASVADWAMRFLDGEFIDNKEDWAKVAWQVEEGPPTRCSLHSTTSMPQNVSWSQNVSWRLAALNVGPDRFYTSMPA